MTNEVVRSRRLRKKLHLDEFAILGFEFSCKITKDADEGYDALFDVLKELVDSRNLFINLDGDEELFEGFVTSGDRYGNATEDDRAAVESLLKANRMVTDASVGNLVDAFYGI